MASFKKHSTGWEYRLKYKDPFTKKTREKSARGFRTKPEAELAAAEFRKSLKQGYEQTDLPLVEFIRTWIDHYKKGVSRKNTIIQHENNLENHIKPYFKKLMMKDLRPGMYQEFLDHCSKKGLSKRTVEIINSTVFGAMEKAVVQGKLERNPCKGTIIKGPEKKRELKFIDSEDIPAFLLAARSYGYIYWMFFRLIIETGLRKGEAAALQWSDVNLKEKHIRVNKTLDFQAAKEEELFGDTKTINSERIVSISNALVNDLRTHAAWQNQNKLHLGDHYKHSLNLVLCRENGDIMPKSTLFNAFQRILRRAGLNDALPIHSLRHTYAVLMLEAGADMKFVQEQLGHSSSQITSDIYAHISKKLEMRNMSKFESFTATIINSGGVSGASHD